MALAIGVVESERQKKRLMEESLWKSQDELLEKERERSVLMRKNQELLAKEAPKKKFVADHLAVFLEGTQSNFGGEEMMNTVATMLKSDADENGGVGGGNGKKKSLGEITFFQKLSRSLVKIEINWLMVFLVFF